MSNIWVTSDSHWNHDRDFIWQARGFSNVEDMNETLIEKWNTVVKPDDIVYHLGDVMLGTDWGWALENLPRLNGIKYLAYGNHCTDNKLEFYREHKIFKEINMGYRLKYHKFTFILSHYPMLVANSNEKRPIWNLHGHIHQTTNFSDIYHAYHVGVDSHNCYPVSLDNIIEDIKYHLGFYLPEERKEEEDE